MYIYCNVEVEGKRINDCVIRAMVLALGMPYKRAVHILYDNGINNCCDSLNIQCYSKIFDKQFKLKKYKCNGLTFQEVAKRFKDNVLIIRTQGHVSVSMFSNIFDTFDCTNYVATDCWLVR